MFFQCLSEILQGGAFVWFLGFFLGFIVYGPKHLVCLDWPYFLAGFAKIGGCGHSAGKHGFTAKRTCEPYMPLLRVGCFPFTGTPWSKTTEITRLKTHSKGALTWFNYTPKKCKSSQS